ncbi:RNA-directed DNA polymerase, eukaryota [Tanacetum coccineum]
MRLLTKDRFAKPSERRANIDMRFPKTISEDQSQDLEREVSKQEIKTAVWGCGTDKSPGPDGFSFGFYRHFWPVIEHDVYMAVNHFFIHGEIPPGCNSSFIALIPKVPDANLVKDFRPISLIGSIYKIIAKILSNRLVNVLGDIVNEVQSAFIAERQMLDGPFILNEILQWCTKKKKKTLIFKVDFEKAFDSIRWDFLDDVLKEFGFRCKWRNWIQSCLTSSKGSILVNGCPTNEFQFYKGLKQGDPLSPFLFILVMESLHLSFQRIVNAGMFKGIVLDQSLCLSHMFYADDAIFLGEWSDGNISTLIHVLKCFFHASGLKINLNKSKIMEINVESAQVIQAAAKLGCLVLKCPFYYLGTRVGGSMTRVQAWQEIVEKVKSRLSKWKSKTLSIGGRLTLLKSVLGSIPVFHMSIFKVPSKSTGIFSVASARRRIDEICLPNIREETRWVKCVPIKINVLAWKIKTDALPTRFNISRRGIDIQDMSCPICDNAIESTDHLFFRCGLVRDIANKVLSWWNLDHANLNSYAEWKSWLVSIRMDSKLKKMFEGVWYSIWWCGLVRDNDNKVLSGGLDHANLNSYAE